MSLRPCPGLPPPGLCAALSALPRAARATPHSPLAVSASLGAAVSMGVPSFYAWVKKRYPLMVQHVHHTCSDSPDGQAAKAHAHAHAHAQAKPKPERS